MGREGNSTRGSRRLHGEGRFSGGMRPKSALLYRDDGHPESRDYDDNYVAVGTDTLDDLRRALSSLADARGRDSAQDGAGRRSIVTARRD